MVPCVRFEDEHLLVVAKPAGLNTHAPAPFAGEGLYDWLRHREPRWAALAIVHRLDKDTSGVMVFGKTPLANRSLTEQFTRRQVRKKYLLLTDRPVPDGGVKVVSALVRAGERYISRPLHAGAEQAETRFALIPDDRRAAVLPGGVPAGGSVALTLVEAEPVTGRTHQIRVHAADRGFPILGDRLYAGSPAGRLCLHAAELALRHPADGRELVFSAPADFAADPAISLRQALIDPAETDAFRLIHGAADGWPDWQVDRFADCLLSQSEAPLTPERRERLRALADSAIGNPAAGEARWAAYHKQLNRRVRQASPAESSPQLAAGEPAPDRFVIRENGARFEISFGEGYSVGLFFDQRDNRRRFLANHVAAKFPLFPARTAANPASPEVLNTFAYTCGFSVCAALAGARTTSLDLSRKYLDWGRRNFELNGLNPAEHDFIFGDVFDWLRRLKRKGRAFDAIVLDPPTFSQSKEFGVFRAEHDFGKLVAAVLPLLRAEGVLLASTNASSYAPEDFLGEVDGAIRSAGRRVRQQHYAPQPPDFPVSRLEPAYLKTVWLRVD